MKHSVAITGKAHEGLRYRSGKNPVFREKIQKWLVENVGLHGIDWHIHIDPKWHEDNKLRVKAHKVDPSVTFDPPTYILRCEKDKAMLFKLTWM